MMTVNEVSKRTGVSIRTLQYYDKIGLLRAAGRTEAGYRLYDDAALERLQQILLFRELEFPLKDIQKIVENPAFDRQKAQWESGCVREGNNCRVRYRIGYYPTGRVCRAGRRESYLRLPHIRDHSREKVATTDLPRREPALHRVST